MKAKSIRPDHTFDIETEGWDSYVLGATYAPGSVKRYTWKQEIDHARALMKLSGNVYAHNGGRFDFLWLIKTVIGNGLLPRGVTMHPVESGSSIIMLNVKGKDVDLTFRDSFAMFPLPLRKLGVKDDTGLDCLYLHEECDRAARAQKAAGQPVKGCGGYCAISRTLPAAKMNRLMDYCVSDCESLYTALSKMIDFAENEAGLALGATVGSTAWRSVVARDLLGKTPHNHRTWDACKRGYHGGRVSLFKAQAASFHRYDITSSYPYQSSQPLPDGEPITLSSGRSAREAYEQQRPGIYDCRVIVPPMYIPPLPIQTKMRKAYPIGEFYGSWPLPEIEYAESLGCRIEPLSATVFPRTTDALKSFMEEMIALRLKHGKDTPQGALLKLWANSIYGKMGQAAPERRTVIGYPEDVPEGSVPLDERGMVWAVPLTSRSPIPPNGHVEKAAYITGRARVQHHRMLVAREDDAIYGDTDSCYSIRKRSKSDGVRPGLGGWDYEGPGSNFQGLAPKVYFYETEKGPRIKAKGIPLTSMDPADTRAAWELLRRGEEWRNRTGITSMRASLRSGKEIFTRKDAGRKLTGAVSFGDRVADGLVDSRPPTIHEVEGVIR